MKDSRVMWDKKGWEPLALAAPALTGRRCYVWWRNPTKMKTQSRLESGCVSKSLSCSWEQALCWSRWKRGVSHWVGALRSAHSPGFGAVCRGGRGDLGGRQWKCRCPTFEACVQMFETVNAPQEKKKSPFIRLLFRKVRHSSYVQCLFYS